MHGFPVRERCTSLGALFAYANARSGASSHGSLSLSFALFPSHHPLPVDNIRFATEERGFPVQSNFNEWRVLQDSPRGSKPKSE